jgi:hypothetical protein
VTSSPLETIITGFMETVKVLMRLELNGVTSQLEVNPPALTFTKVEPQQDSQGGFGPMKLVPPQQSTMGEDLGALDHR